MPFVYVQLNSSFYPHQFKKNGIELNLDPAHIENYTEKRERQENIKTQLL